MANMYQLKESLVTEYEWNKGPRPSGYARLRLQLRPDLSDEEVMQVTTASGTILDVRLTEYAKKKPLSDLEVSAFMDMIIKGVHDGAKQALMQSLDRPVINVTIVLEQVTVDLIYSTEAAFRIAARSVVEKLLRQAAEEGLLELSSEH